MKAAVLRGPRDLVVRQIPEWTLAPDTVMLRVKACGICGSDLRYFEGENPWALHTLGRPLPNPPNIVLGHEFAGEVVASGSAAWRHLVGKRVGAQCFITCGACELCLGGRENLCPDTIHIGHGAGWGGMDFYPGAMAETCPVWGRQCYELPDRVSWEEAALLDPLQVGVHAVEVSGMRLGACVAVLGLGPIGLSVLQVARAYGARVTVGSDVYGAPLDIALAVGATAAVNAREADVVAAVRERTGGRGADVVVDTIGSRDSLRQGLAALAKGGALVELAVHPGDYSFDGLALGGERSIRASSNAFYRDYGKALGLVLDGRVSMSAMITHRFSLDEVQEAFALLLEKESRGAVKAIVAP